MTDRDEEAPSSTPADLSVGHLFRLLRPREVYGIFCVLIALLAGAFVAGRWSERLLSLSSGTESKDPVAVFMENSPQQLSLRRQAPIAAFEEFLDAAASDRWSDAFALTSAAWRAQHRTSEPEDLKRDYRMTQRHQYHYYIPRDMGDERAEFDVDLEYWDFLPPLPVRESLRMTALHAALADGYVDQYARELLQTLKQCYDTSTMSEGILKERVTDFARTRTVRDLVIRDDIIEDLGRRLLLTPILPSDTYQGKVPARSKKRLVNAAMVREHGAWRIHSYDSYMAEKQ